MPVNFLNCVSTQAPATGFSDCAPLPELSEIEYVAIGNPQSAAFTDITSAAELMTRISPTLVGNNAIRLLTVIGELPAPAPVTINMSGGRVIDAADDNTLTLTIDDLSQANYDYAAFLKKNPYQKLFFFVNQSQKMYHFGNAGIGVKIAVVANMPTGRDSITTLTLTATWRSVQQLPFRLDYPLGTGNSTSTLANPNVTVSNQTNTTLRLNRNDVTNATSYVFALYTDAARTQLARPAQTIASTGNAYADFDTLTAGTTYYGKVTASANNYTSGTGLATAATTNNQTVKVLMMPANSVTAKPTLAQINAGITVTGPLHGPIVATFPDSAGVPKRPTIAFRAGGFNPDTWTDTGNPSNTGPIGTSTPGSTPTNNVFDNIGNVTDAGNPDWVIVQTTSNTDFDGTSVSFTE